MKIISLQAENVKRIRAVTIKPDGSLVRIHGNNGQGKTSCLDAIQLALGGKSAQPPKVIREGAESAQVVLDLGELVVTRRWTANDKSYLDVKSRDGAKFSSPQAMLDKLVGSLSFDPLAFSRMDPKKQLETLRQLVGVDTSALEADRQKFYDDRTAVNRELQQVKARMSALPAVEAPDEEVSLADLLQEQQQLLADQTANDRLRSEAAKAEQDRAAMDRKVHDAESRVQRLRADLAQAEKDAALFRSQLEMESDAAASLKAEVSKLVDPDLGELAGRMRSVEQTNQRVRAKKTRAEVAERVEAMEAKTALLSASIANIDRDKEELIRAARFPVEGLSFGEEGITFNGIPIEQASGAEQLRVSLAMGLALNPKLKVMLIRDGSLLDQNSLELVAQMADEAGAQVWIEAVGTGGTGVLIEDGMVAGAADQELQHAS